MRIVDLTTTIKPHFRWKVEFAKSSAHNKGDFFESTGISLGGHGFTHIDAPYHYIPAGRRMEDVPLDWLVGEAAVLNLTDKKDNEQITSHDLAGAATHLRTGDKIVLLRNDRDLRYSTDTPEHWTTPPYLTRDAAEWLVKQGLKTIGWDFPGDYVLRDFGKRPLAADEFYTHYTILGNDMINVEYLTNLQGISRDRVLVVISPLKVGGGAPDTAPCRVFAIED